MTSLTKNPHPPIFSIANYKTCRIFRAFEQLSTTFGTRVMLTQSHVQSSYFGTKSSKQAGRASVNEVVLSNNYPNTCNISPHHGIQT